MGSTSTRSQLELLKNKVDGMQRQRAEKHLELVEAAVALKDVSLPTLDVDAMEAKYALIDKTGLSWPPHTLAKVECKRLEPCWENARKGDERAMKKIASTMRPWKLRADSPALDKGASGCVQLPLPDSEQVFIWVKFLFEDNLATWISDGAPASRHLCKLLDIVMAEWAMPDDDVVISDPMAVAMSSALTSMKALSLCDRTSITENFDLDNVDAVVALEALACPRKGRQLKRV